MEWLVKGKLMNKILKILSFNPCCNGMVGKEQYVVFAFYSGQGFNPCWNGMVGKVITKMISEMDVIEF